MRPSNKSRSRNKNNNRNRNVGNVINRVFDSAGPEGKVRGTPQQIIDKYQMLARDAQLSGDRVAAENFQQHAEHYSRLLGEAQREQAERQQQQAAANQQQDTQQRQQPQPQNTEAGDQQPAHPANGNGLDMIEPQDADETADLVETPESASKPRPKRPRASSKAASAEPKASEGSPPIDAPAAD